MLLFNNLLLDDELFYST